MNQNHLIRADVDNYQEASRAHTFVDYHQSKGNYIRDADGNTMLDLCSMENLPLGHNHAEFLSILNSKDLDYFIQNSNGSAAERASGDFAKMVNSVMSPIAPRGLGQVTLTGGRNAVEQAIFAAMVERGSDSRMSALGFEGSHHGNSLVLTQFAHPSMSLSLGWPSVRYPTSTADESQILDEVRSALKTKHQDGKPVAAIVVEPTNFQSGHAAS